MPDGSLMQERRVSLVKSRGAALAATAKRRAIHAYFKGFSAAIAAVGVSV